MKFFLRKDLKNTAFCENYLWTEGFDEKHVTSTNNSMKTMSK